MSKSFEAFKKYESAQAVVRALASRNSAGLSQRERFEASVEYEKATTEAFKTYQAYQEALSDDS